MSGLPWIEATVAAVDVQVDHFGCLRRWLNSLLTLISTHANNLPFLLTASGSEARKENVNITSAPSGFKEHRCPERSCHRCQVVMKTQAVIGWVSLSSQRCRAGRKLMIAMGGILFVWALWTLEWSKEGQKSWEKKQWKGGSWVSDSRLSKGRERGSNPVARELEESTTPRSFRVKGKPGRGND